VAFRHPGKRGKRDPAELLPVRPQAGKALWREYTGLLLTSQDAEELRPKIIRQIERLIDRDLLNDMPFVLFRCIGLRTDGKAKVFEWLDEALEAPPRLLVDPDGALVVEDALSRAGDAEQVLNFVFNLHFRPEREQGKQIQKGKDVVRFKTLRDRMQAAFWERLAPEFHQLIFAAADPAQRTTAERVWADSVVRIGSATFTETADQVGDRADALRARVEAQAACRRRLYAKRKEWFGE
jgi:CRISPR system Cascade subunit CasA